MKNSKGNVVVGLMPGAVSLQIGAHQGSFEVKDIRFSSGEYHVLVGEGEHRLYVSSHLAPAVAIGEYVNLSFTPEHIRVYAK